MINSSYVNRPTEMPVAEMRLVYQAKSGDVKAFVGLYDSYVERVYRYLHFLVPNNRIAEGLTFQVFIKAWEQLDRYQIFGASFSLWLYAIARNQVTVFFHTHKNMAPPDNEFTLAARGGKFREEFQTIRDGMKFLTADQQHALILKFIVGMPDKHIARLMTRRVDDIRELQLHALYKLTDHLARTESRTISKDFPRILEDCLTRISSGASTLDDCLMRYPEHAPQLEPLLGTAFLLDMGRDVKPLPTFNAYTHDALIHYLRSRPRQPQINFAPILRRTALTFAVVVVALLITGTAYAQSALPGEPLYSWKRTSEQVWHALSPNPLAVDIALAERRLEEWIAVADDPILSNIAMLNYQEAISRLASTDNPLVESLLLIASTLESQQQSLEAMGLSSPELNEYLIEVSGLLPSNEVPQTVPVEVVPTVIAVPPAAASTDVVIETCAPECADMSVDSSTGAANTTAGENGNAGGNGSASGIGNGVGTGTGLGIGIGGGNSQAGGNGNGGGGDNGGGNDDKGEKDNNGKGR